MGTDDAKSGAVLLDEFIVRWDYNGDGKITVSLNDAEDKLIQSIEHVKSKFLNYEKVIRITSSYRDGI